VASALSPASPVLRDAQAIVAELRDPLPEGFVREFQSGSAFLPVPESFFQTVVEESLKAPARAWQGAIDGLLRYEDRSSLSQITAPTLLIWGEHDAVFEGVVDQKRLAAAIPYAELNIYAGTGHCPNWERPEQVSREIASFIRLERAAEAAGYALNAGRTKSIV
jgi:pimeloyl-ACP methyl ester carboxylesterase